MKANEILNVSASDDYLKIREPVRFFSVGDAPVDGRHDSNDISGDRRAAADSRAIWRNRSNPFCLKAVCEFVSSKIRRDGANAPTPSSSPCRSADAWDVASLISDDQDSGDSF